MMNPHPLRISIALLFALSAASPAWAASQTPKATEFGADWDDPRTAAPPMQRPPTPHCTVEIVDHGFKDFEPYKSSIAPPAECPGPWNRIVLDMEGSVEGRQYDRMAGIEIGGITVFRTSTPEPSREGISWHVEKDLSQYAPLFTQQQEVAMTLGNVVNETYTGVFRIKARVTFYQADAKHPAMQTADYIELPQGLRRDGPDVTGKLTLPAATRRLLAEVYATGSGGGCEEFWYFTTPADAKYSCPAEHGPYREVQVLLDGRVAGIAMPYPHIYTGGWSNPFLWYVLPAPRAFDIRPIHYDLTPFIGELNDGKSHELRFRVLGVGADSKGWALLPSLQLWLDAGGKATRGRLLEYQLDELALTHPVSTAANGDSLVTTRGGHRLKLRGELHTSRGKIETTVERIVANSNDHRWDPAEKHDALAIEWTDTIHTATKGSRQAAMPTTQRLRYAIDGEIRSEKVDGHERLTTTLELDDEAAWLRYRGKRVAASAETRDHFEGSASYTSDVPREKRNAVGRSRQRYTQRDGQGHCYDRTIAQENGFVTEDLNRCKP